MNAATTTGGRGVGGGAGRGGPSGPREGGAALRGEGCENGLCDGEERRVCAQWAEMGVRVWTPS
jgi:hypothetical protein